MIFIYKAFEFCFSNFALTFETPKYFITYRSTKILSPKLTPLHIFLCPNCFSASTIYSFLTHTSTQTLTRPFDYYAAIICQTYHGCPLFFCKVETTQMRNDKFKKFLFFLFKPLCGFQELVSLKEEVG